MDTKHRNGTHTYVQAKHPHTLNKQAKSSTRKGVLVPSVFLATWLFTQEAWNMVPCCFPPFLLTRFSFASNLLKVNMYVLAHVCHSTCQRHPGVIHFFLFWLRVLGIKFSLWGFTGSTFTQNHLCCASTVWSVSEILLVQKLFFQTRSHVRRLYINKWKPFPQY